MFNYIDFLDWNISDLPSEVNEPGCTLECGDNMYCKNRGVPAPTCVCVTGTVLVGELCLGQCDLTYR